MIYVGHERIRYKDMRMSHMVADTLEELHGMAEKLGLRSTWFQVSRLGIPHYDLCESKRSIAITYGAKSVTAKELIEFCHKFQKEHHVPEQK